MNRKNYIIVFAMIFFAFTANSQKWDSSNPDFTTKEKAMANQYVKTTESMKQISSVKAIIFEDDFESDLGWVLEGGWARDAAVAEPDAAHSGDNILANPLGVDYENGMTEEFVTSPVIDCSGQTAVYLSYWSFSGCETSSFDHMGIEVYDGAIWIVIWSNDDWGGSTQETAWTYYEFNVTDYAAGNADFQARFYMGETDASVTYSGWAIDDFVVSYPESHDLGVNAVFPTIGIPETTYTPSATIRNFGGSEENNYNVEIEITDDGGSQVFMESLDFTDVIGIGEEYVAEMSTTWTPATTGTYTVTATVTVADDANPDNDEMIADCFISYMYFMGGDDATTCTGLFYDSGGPDADYENNEYFVMTFYPGTAGTMMQVEFLTYEVEGSSYDYLAIYNGEDINAELIDTHEGTADDFYFQGQTIAASNPTGALTFEFTTDASVIKPGWEAVISCVNAVTFHVTDANANNIENALVEVDGQSGTTDVDGNAMFALAEGEVSYTVTADFCDPTTGTYVVTPDPGQIVEISLDCAGEYSVTFNAFENFGTNEPVEGVDISVTHTESGTVWDETTNTSGVAVFILPATDYEFSVEAQGYVYGGTTALSVSGDMSVDLPLDENLIAPTGLVVENIDEYQGIADFSWFAGFSGSILVVDHDASNAVDFTDDWGYIQPALDANNLDYTYYEADAATFEGPDLATMQEYEAIIWFTGEGWHLFQTMTMNDELNLAAYLDGGGKLFISSQDYVWDVYSQDPDFTFSAGQFPYDYLGLTSVHQDAWWLSGGESIAHEGAVGSLAEGYSFQCDDIYTTTKEGLSADQITGHDATDMLNVTDDPAGITAIQNGNVVCWLGSIASVTDEEIRANLILDILDYLALGDKAATKSFESFNVFLDDMGTPIATGVTDSTYHFTDLTPGQTYTAGVSATYTTGESEIATLEFTVPLIINVNEEVNPEISIFPNPSNGIFTITTSDTYTLEIMDITGKVILSGKLTQAQTDIDLSGHDTGLYFIRLTNNETTINYKIVVD
jgi:hypothetical protein